MIEKNKLECNETGGLISNDGTCIFEKTTLDKILLLSNLSFNLPPWHTGM